MINWKYLDSDSAMEEVINSSFQHDVMIFKHSTTCSISLMAKMRLENTWSFEQEQLTPYYLDLKTYRHLSNEVAEKYAVTHESPQVLIIRKNECIYDASHLDISVDEIKETLAWHAQST